ncbi:MAG: hypothetical protein ABSG88_13500 [Bradyrhizobium sp.]
MIAWLMIIHPNQMVGVMLKSEPASYRERQTINDLDQESRALLDALRRPLKLTAALKRRALKKKANVKSTLVEVMLATEAGKGH